MKYFYKNIGLILHIIGFILILLSLINIFLYEKKLTSHLLIVMGMFLVYIGRQFIAKSYISTISDTNIENPILFLRPFSKDESIFHNLNYVYANYGVYETEEQSLARYLNQIGTFIAIGNPNKYLPTLGARRLYKNDDEWKDSVLNLIKNSQLIILRIGVTDNFIWEFEKVYQYSNPNKIILFHPINSYFGKKRKKRDKEYYEFKDKVENILDITLPSDIGDNEFIIFNNSWKFLELRESISNNLWGLIRGWASGSQLPHIIEAIRPVIQRIHYPIPKNPFAPIEYVTLPLFIVISIALPLVILLAILGFKFHT